jgi:hypothetical protein
MRAQGTQEFYASASLNGQRTALVGIRRTTCPDLRDQAAGSKSILRGNVSRSSTCRSKASPALHFTRSEYISSHQAEARLSVGYTFSYE